VSKRPVHQGEHSPGEVVLLNEQLSIDLALEKGVEAENGGPPIGREDGGAGLAGGGRKPEFEAAAGFGSPWSPAGARIREPPLKADAKRN
jgi:hypothetical protein